MVRRKSPETRLAEILIRWGDDPGLFVDQCLRAKVDVWQKRALEAVKSNDRIAIKSGHGVGKSTFLSWLILWYLICWSPCKILCTANRKDQLADVLWAECAKWHRRMPDGIRSLIEIQSDKIFIKELPNEAFAAARTARPENPEALQGFHATNFLLIADEASGIEDIIFEVALGTLSTENSKIILTGNPTRAQGYFYRAFTDNRARWNCFTVSSLEAKYATKEYAQEIEDTYGRSSNQYRVRVLGEFPTSEDDQVIPFDLVEGAINRDVLSDRFRVVWGVDVARFGDDRSSLAKRRGNTLLEPVQWWQGKDTQQIAGIITSEFSETYNDDKPNDILVDVIGLGAGVLDRLVENGLPARGINVAEVPSSKDLYLRKRDELWFMAREWFAKRNCKIPDDSNLIKELCAPLYTTTGSGKIQVESKADMKKRGFRSPDIADSFILTFAGGIDRIYEPVSHERKRYNPRNKRYRQQASTWMGYW